MVLHGPVFLCQRAKEHQANRWFLVARAQVLHILLLAFLPLTQPERHHRPHIFAVTQLGPQSQEFQPV
jgi:hypothetical protein